MNTEELIKALKNSGLYAECPCGGEFKLSDAILFDGTKPFPPDAEAVKLHIEEHLCERESDLKKRIERAKKGVKRTTSAVNIGFHLEKTLLTLKGFRWAVPDCRFLANPIDFLAFDGMSKDNISSIEFVEVKSGKSPLNPHQKMIKDAVEDKKVSYKEFT